MKSSPDDLRRRFLSAIGAEPPMSPEQMWRIFVEHPWYQQQLGKCAAAALQRREMPMQWLEDVQHDVLILWEQKFRRKLTLHVDPDLVDDRFVAWINTILTRDCLQAIRRLRRIYRRCAPLRNARCVNEDAVPLLEAQIDIDVAIERLDEPARTILLLYVKGYSVTEISRLLQLNYPTTYRYCRLGIQHLQHLLGDGRE